MSDTQHSAKPNVSLRVTWIVTQLFWYLGWVAATLNLALLLATASGAFQVQYVQLPVTITFEEPIQAERLGTDEALPVVSYERGSVRVDAENMRGQAVWLLVPALLLAGYLFVVYQLRLFLRTVQTGTPFVRENPKRLRMIGLIVAIGGPVYGFLEFLYGRIHVYQLDIPGATLEVPINIYPFVIFLGLIVLIIAQVFDHGIRLQTEQDLTV